MKSSRQAFTVVELLVCIGIIGLLCSILVPAVQSARESARRLQCASKLGQIMAASLVYETVHGRLPPGAFLGKPVELLAGSSVASPENGGFSGQCCVLPYIGEKGLYDSLNFALPAMTMANIGLYHSTFASHVVGAFLCPSDPLAVTGGVASNSYRACRGLGGMERIRANVFRMNQDGAFATSKGDDGQPKGLSISEFVDGASNTLGYSEKLVGDRQSGSIRQGVWFSVSKYGLSPAEWVTTCASVNIRKARPSAGGSSWILPGVEFTHFYSNASPGTRVPDCGMSSPFYGVGVFAAASLHSQGVNACMVDGSVRFVSSSISVELWRALGTRNGLEITDL